MVRMQSELIPMREVSWQDYYQFLSEHGEVVIEETHIPLSGPKQIDSLQPEPFELERTTVWSFPERGDWATHKGNYRGN
ncbi:MAG: hypothetical protein ABDI19_04895 [Armatimonadota bacterium]